MAAAKNSIADSGIDLDKVDKKRFGVLIGSGVGGLEAVEELKARFPITLAPLAEFRTLDTERGYVMARGPTDGDNSMQGLQMRWRMRCNKDRPDDEELPAWRLFLHRWWRMCSSCRETLPGRSEGSAANVKEMEAAAWKREAFLCASCQGD